MAQRNPETTTYASNHSKVPALLLAGLVATILWVLVRLLQYSTANNTSLVWYLVFGLPILLCLLFLAGCAFALVHDVGAIRIGPEAVERRRVFGWQRWAFEGIARLGRFDWTRVSGGDSESLNKNFRRDAKIDLVLGLKDGRIRRITLPNMRAAQILDDLAARTGLAVEIIAQKGALHRPDLDAWKA